MTTPLDVLRKRADFEDLLIADGFDDAICGVLDPVSGPPLVCYSTQRCLDILVEQGMDEEEAQEFFDFNVVAAYVGPRTPLFVWMRETT